ncbi:CDP-alcohol phosphatidyltransferase family protein [Leucobacter tenebrionis]|uniref:CDP-alcohol phosphatidyltransferase family protein n=1 Tax=Leucobacter tenebrionis TaxID=2873270 RepID=UPI001CA71CEB|nr:CDP-alcohol phosphatidyltransferase family protein [Leucobacter tenebrionis]QZY53140.1 CDP-alcohol phosphatidyltransferase family protein [Leucobacter tenebrionis]
MLERGTRGYRENVITLQNAQKSGAGVPAYMRWVNRWLGRRIAAAAAVVGLTPNAVTAISALCSLAGLVLLVAVEPGIGVGIAVAVLLALGFACDSADGQLARLTGTGGPAGEWMDHVVDAIRTPLTHVAVAVAWTLHRPETAWVAAIALAYAVVSAGQFMSQILAEQLVRQRGGEAPEASGVPKSLALIPTDTGTLCWSFALWGAPLVFVPVYALLFGVNAVYAVVSMRRKYLRLRAL